MLRTTIVMTLAMACTWLLPTSAQAQYKNSAYGFGIGGGLVNGAWGFGQPSAIDSDTNQMLSPDNRPLRLQTGLRLGGESNYKLNEDRWWFTGKLNVAFYRYATGDATGDLDAQFDAAASSAMGTLFGTQAAVGIRYFFLTDRTRPYIEGSFSTMHLLSFNQQAAEACTNESVCNGDTNQTNFLRQAWVPALHIQPGIEMIFSRDIALHIFLDLQHWFIINAEDNQSIILGLGCNFYT